MPRPREHRGTRADGRVRRDVVRALGAVTGPAVLVGPGGLVRALNAEAARRFTDLELGAPAPWRVFSLDGQRLGEDVVDSAARAAMVLERRVLLEERNGARRPLLMRAVPLWERDGSTPGVLVTFLDASRDALAELEAYRRAFQLCDDLLVVVRPDGLVLRANEGVTHRLGWQAEALPGTPIEDLLHPDDVKATLEALRRGEPSTGAIIRTKDRAGELHLLSWTMRPESSVVFGPVVYLRGVDVTQTLRREEELVTSRELLAEAQDIAHIGTVTLDYRTRRFEMSAQFERLVSLPNDADLLGEIEARVSAPDRSQLVDALRRGRLGLPSTLQLSAQLERGPRDLKVWTRPHSDARGKVVRLVAVVQDVSDEVRLAAQLRLAERMASLGTLAAGLAHEVNNPLAFMVANLNSVRAELSRVDAVPGLDLADLRAALAETQEGAERVAAIVANLRAFSSGDEERCPAPCDVIGILEGVLALTRNEVRHRAKVVTHFQPTPPVMANQARLGQVFLNLVLNAAHAITDGRVDENTITLTTSVEGGQVLVAVEDTGKGIAPEHVARVFDPFFSTKGAGRGAGMGLFLAQGIVRDLGGQIDVTSTLGEGTRFCVRLPSTEVAPRPSPNSLRRRTRVLVVDDEPLVVRFLLRLLGREHDVTTATSGREALERLSERTFDAVLCDVVMPELSGIEVWERLEPPQRARLVFMTGNASVPEVHAFLCQVRAPVLKKPFTAESLGATLAPLVAARERRTE